MTTDLPDFLNSVNPPEIDLNRFYYNIFEYQSMEKILSMLINIEFFKKQHYIMKFACKKNENKIYNSLEDIYQYHHIINIGSQIIFVMYYDWFPHILVIDFDYLKKPRKIFSKVDHNRLFLNWKTNELFTKKEMIQYLNWKKYETVERCQKANKHFCQTIEIKIDNDQTKKYCHAYYPSMIQSDKKGCPGLS
jgi:hypothetical protein